MSYAFLVEKIEAASAAPLYLYASGRRTVVPAGQWQVLWQARNISTVSFTAFNLSRLPVIDLRVTCKFGRAFLGKNLVVQASLSGAPVAASVVAINSEGPIVVQSFHLIKPSSYPVQFIGPFQWNLVENLTVVAHFPTYTNLELYTVSVPIASLWPPFGVSVKLLRRYLPLWFATSSWRLVDFYRYIVQKIFDSPFLYDNVMGNPRYAEYIPGNDGTWKYKLDQYFSELDSNLKVKVNCYDMAGIIQVILSLFPNYSLVGWKFVQPYGWINPTR
jgi:hypothetical protein